MPIVSIIVPIYNVEKYLAECLDSIVNQTFKDIEVICVNDASPDNSKVILQEFASRDSRIRIITHDKNGGLGAARNTGICNATSPYIAFVDSDDYIAPTFIEVLYELITANKAQMSWCGTNTVSERGALLDSYTISGGVWAVLEIMDNEAFYPSILPVWNKMFHRELIKDIKQLPIVSEDQPALAEYLTKCDTIATTEKALYFYRQNNNTLSKPIEPKPSLWNDFFYSHQLFFDILKEKYPDKNQLKKQAILRHFSMLWRIKSFNLLKLSNWDQQEQIIKKHLRDDKIGLRGYSPLMYYFLLLIFSFKWSRKIKKNLVQIGITLSRGKWVKRDSIWYLPFDLLKVMLPSMKWYAKQFLDAIELSILKSFAFIHKWLFPRPIWLIGERPDTAQDNGLYFFKYLNSKQQSVKAFYIIEKGSKQYFNVKSYGKVVPFNGFWHKCLFLRCNYYVSSHNHFCFPITRFTKRRYKLASVTRNVFLQHGITYSDNSDDYGKYNSSINTFICGAKPEYEFVKDKFGYLPSDVKFTGFARFDGLHEFNTKRQILLMPTWRKEIWRNKLKNNDEYFLNSIYFNILQSLIKNTRLIGLLHKYNYHLIFYPHYEIQSYLYSFMTVTDRIVLASKDKYDVSTLLKESSLLITDSSSVNFDFAYMYKPLIYYFFDRENFVRNHLKPGYFKHEEDGFGRIVMDEESLITQIEEYLKNDCSMEEEYRNRVTSFFTLHDNNNCERIYQAIIKA